MSVYLEYLRDICNCFERSGVTLNLDFESSRFALQRSVMILEDWLYFNDFLKAVDSPHKIRTLYNSSEFSYYNEVSSELSVKNSVSLGNSEISYYSLHADTPEEFKEVVGVVHDISSFNKMLVVNVERVKSKTNSDVYALESSLFDMHEPSLDALEDLSYTSTEENGRGMPNGGSNDDYYDDSYYSDDFDDYEEYDTESEDYVDEDAYEYDTDSEDYVDDYEYDTESEDYVDDYEDEEYNTDSEDYEYEDEEYYDDFEDYEDEEYDTESEDYVDEYEDEEYYDDSEDMYYDNNSNSVSGGGSNFVSTSKSPQMSVSGTPKQDLDSDNKLADMLSIHVNQGVSRLFAKFKNKS